MNYFYRWKWLLSSAKMILFIDEDDLSSSSKIIYFISKDNLSSSMEMYLVISDWFIYHCWHKSFFIGGWTVSFIDTSIWLRDLRLFLIDICMDFSYYLKIPYKVFQVNCTFTLKYFELFKILLSIFFYFIVMSTSRVEFGFISRANYACVGKVKFFLSLGSKLYYVDEDKFFLIGRDSKFTSPTYLRFEVIDDISFLPWIRHLIS